MHHTTSAVAVPAPSSAPNTAGIPPLVSHATDANDAVVVVAAAHTIAAPTDQDARLRDPLDDRPHACPR